MELQQDTQILDRLAALNAARNCGQYGPVAETDAEVLEATALLQEVGVNARDMNGLERPFIVPTAVAYEIAKALRDFFRRGEAPAVPAAGNEC
jgi:hypothetical protein